MANTTAPSGFADDMRVDGAAWTGNQNPYPIATAYSTAIYKGDPVLLAADGSITRGAPGTTAPSHIGIFNGCKYLASANNTIMYSPSWPGGGNVANSAIEAYVIDDPNVVFRVQSSGTAITQADVGMNIDYTLGTGNAGSGISGAMVNQATIAVTATLPFRIVGTAKGSGNGYDHTSSFNKILVAWNNHALRQMTGA